VVFCGITSVILTVRTGAKCNCHYVTARASPQNKIDTEQNDKTKHKPKPIP